MSIPTIKFNNFDLNQNNAEEKEETLLEHSNAIEKNSNQNSLNVLIENIYKNINEQNELKIDNISNLKKEVTSQTESCNTLQNSGVCLEESNKGTSIEYSQLLNLEERNHTFINELFEKIGFKSRAKYLLSKQPIKIKSVPLIEEKDLLKTKKENLIETIFLRITTTDKLSYDFSLSDEKGVIGAEVDCYAGGSSHTWKISKNQFSGTINLKMILIILSLFNAKQNTLVDDAYITCKNCPKEMYLRTLSMLTKGSSFYITRGYQPAGTGINKYHEAVKFFRNITLTELEKEIKKSKNKIIENYGSEGYKNSFIGILNELKSIINQGIKKGILENQDIELSNIAIILSRLENSNDKELHSIFHGFFTLIDKFFYTEIITNENESTDIEEHIKNLGFRSELFKDIPEIL